MRRPFVQTWVDTLFAERAEHSNMDAKTKLIVEQLFDQYVPGTLEMLRKNKCQHVTPLMDFALVETLTDLLSGLLTPANCPPGSEKDVFEAYFQFCSIWAFGGALTSEKSKDHLRKINVSSHKYKDFSSQCIVFLFSDLPGCRSCITAGCLASSRL